MPECLADLWLDAGGGIKLLGEAAHIHGENPGSARFVEDIPLPDRNKIENLILMCPSHHAEIDADEITWTAERLINLKATQEERAYMLYMSGKEWRQKFIIVDYLNLPRLLGMPGGLLLEKACVDAGLKAGMTFRDVVGLGMGAIERSARALFKQWDARLVALADLNLAHEGEGQLVWFDATAYTRNGPMPGTSQTVTGDLAHDPHIWFMQGTTRVSVRYDPAWVTTSTAYSNLRAGTSRFAGFGLITERTSDGIVISAWALGKPMAPGVEGFYT